MTQFRPDLEGGPVRSPEAGQTPEPPPLDSAAAALSDSGGSLFENTCIFCHTGRGEARPSPYPDLHRMSPETHAAFEEIVLGGKYRSGGMASFVDLFSPEQARMIHAWLIREQGRLRARSRPAKTEEGLAGLPTGPRG